MKLDDSLLELFRLAVAVEFESAELSLAVLSVEFSEPDWIDTLRVYRLRALWTFNSLSFLIIRILTSSS
jgi:hypothetical protein